eukprot:15468632-Alexandrium_andersonii.AAC.1
MAQLSAIRRLLAHSAIGALPLLTWWLGLVHPERCLRYTRERPVGGVPRDGGPPGVGAVGWVGGASAIGARTCTAHCQ